MYPVFADGEGEPVVTIGIFFVSTYGIECNQMPAWKLYCLVTDVNFHFITVKTGNPPAYMMLMFISLICIAVFVTLVLSQNQ